MIKKYSLVLVAIFCFVLSGFGQTYNQITSLTELTDGYYVIAESGESFAMNNSHNGTYLDRTAISPTASTITNPPASIIWKIETNGSGRSIYSENSSKYISYTGSSNNVQIVDNVTTNNQRWNVTYSGGDFIFSNTAITSRDLQYNPGSPRFACYTGSQNDLALYKLDVPTGPTVTYNGNGNTGGSVPTDASSPYTSGDDVIVLGNTGSLTNTCSTFNNWNTAADGSGFSRSAGDTFTISANTTLYAQWTSIGNTVTFDSNGGTGTMTSQIDCTTASLTNITFTYTGFTFNSWNTVANGSGTTYADGASYDFSADITLYAQWDVYVGPCIGLDNFDTSLPTGYNLDGTYRNTGSAFSGTYKIGFNDVGDNLDLPATSNPMSLSFWARLSGGSGSQIRVQYDNSGTWTDVGTAQTVAGTSYMQYTFDLSSISSFSNVDLRLNMVTQNNSIYLDDLEVYCGAPIPTPEMNLTQGVTSYATSTVAGTSDTYNFGNHLIGTDTDIQFTIENTGDADLTLSAPVISGTGFSLQTGLSLAMVPGPSGTSTFTVRFLPNALGGFSGTISIANNDSDENPYIINIIGYGTNSNTSDIIANGTFVYNSDIDYTAYQAATITNTGQSIDVFKFDIRDGGASNDADALGTELNAIVFDVVNIDNIRNAALFNGNAMVANNPVIAGNTISFSGLSYAAPDNGVSPLTLRVTLLTTVTDNDQLQFTINSATANTSGSVFGNGNAGGATSLVTGDRNRIEVIADRLNFLQQPSTTSTNATMTPAVQVEAIDVQGNRDLDWTGNISITSDGTMTGDPITAASASSISTFNSITHTASGTGLTLTATATGLINDTSTLFDIILFTFNAGDFRPSIGFVDFSFNGSWEYFNGSAWITTAGSGWDGNAPQNTTTTITRILIDKDDITAGGSSSNNYNCDILILSGGTLIINDNDNPPIAAEFLSPGNTLEVREGAQLLIQGDIDLPSSANLIVRSGGYMTINQNSMNNNHPMWDGNEKFESGSTLEINDWDWTISPGSRSLINVYATITDNDNGYKFGNVILDTNGIVDGWTIVGGPRNVNVTENDFTINNSSSSYVGATSNKDPDVSATFGGNLIINDGDFYFGTSYTTDPFDQDVRILGDVIVNSDDDFYIHKEFNSSTATITAGNSPVIIEGNLEISSTVNNVNSDVTSKEILFSGNNSHAIEVSPNCTNVPFVIESGDTGTLLNEHLKFTGDSSLEVESGAIFNFNFNGATALEVQDISGDRNKFISQTNSTLYITHPEGIWDSSTQGNVEGFAATNTTYNQTATFYYVGKQNQVTGDALTVGSTVKNVYVILDNNNLELRLTNRTGISDGGKLEIQQGIVIGEEAGANDNDFYGPDGQLIMTGGEYRISTITANPLTDYLPQLRKYGSYSLTDGTVHLNGNDEIQILSGTPNYYNLAFSGSNILATLPPLPPNIPNYKGLSNGTSVSNNITISEDAIVDIQNWTLGGSGTNLIMEDQSRFIMAGSGTKPDATGTYTFDINTTIEFNNTGGFESIRLTNPVPIYANIVVSGNNVGTIADGSGPNSFIQFQPNGSFTVSGTGIFKQSNTNGFSGLANTSISSTNDPSITLLDNSTIEYQGADQTITSFIPEYKNVIISGIGLKTLGHPTDVYVGEDLNMVSSTLTINTNEAITVDEGVKITGGNFNIEDSGSLVQVNDTDSNSGSISMKRTANIRRLDYVYWSSPVVGFNIDDVYQLDTPTDKIYRWNTTITNPNGGQGNWIPANGEIMQKGIGYIVRGPDSFTTTAQNKTATFDTGKPHNGTITINVSRGIDNISEDDNWNLIGNPYPSAIDAYSFLNDPLNSALDGLVNIWTHGNLPIYATDPFYDNFGSNYTAADYITYNGLGSMAGIGDLYIAAGQSFMVNMLNDTNTTDDSATSTVVFNNGMRDKAFINSQFYKTAGSKTNEKHRVWLDFVSEGQPTARLLVGYAEGATMGRDRMFDAITDNQAFYSLIENKKFVIQGLALPFNDTDAIPLGVNIAAQGIHYIAIAFIDGLFETDEQTIYLKDNVLGITHNLTNQPYSFAADEGIHNTRFEIVFRDSSLSVDENILDNNGLTIIERSNDNVQFTINSSNLTIKDVEIIDLLGRTLYRFKGTNNTETYNLSNLSSSAYMARVTLSNNQVIVKKAIKK